MVAPEVWRVSYKFPEMFADAAADGTKDGYDDLLAAISDIEQKVAAAGGGPAIRKRLIQQLEFRAYLAAARAVS